MSEHQLNKWATELELLIQRHLANPQLSVSWLAEVVYLSERQLNRRCKSSLGITAGQLIQQYKLAFAHDNLSQPSAPTVRQIASYLNFSDAKYFSRLFLKHFGVYPSSLSPRRALGGPAAINHQITAA